MLLWIRLKFDQDHIDTILEGLPEEYNSFVMMIYACVEPASMDDIEALLIVQDSQFEKYRQELSSSSVSLNVAQPLHFPLLLQIITRVIFSPITPITVLTLIIELQMLFIRTLLEEEVVVAVVEAVDVEVTGLDANSVANMDMKPMIAGIDLIKLCPNQHLHNILRNINIMSTLSMHQHHQ